MMWRTHAVIGANAGLAALTFFGGTQIGAALAIGAFAGLLPDIDASYAKVHTLGPLGIFRGRGEYHRRFFHSLLLIVLLAVIAGFAVAEEWIPLAFAFVFGYASHPLIDGLNYAGVEYLWPLKKKFRLVPRPLRVRVGSQFDQGLFILATLGVVAQLLPLLLG